MKLETTIAPRRDGKVNVELDGALYAFVADNSGALVCEVENEAHLAHLLRLGDQFLPADEEDFAAASSLVAIDRQDGDSIDDDNEDPVDMNAAPIEEPASVVAAQPASPKAGRKKK